MTKKTNKTDVLAALTPKTVIPTASAAKNAGDATETTGTDVKKIRVNADKYSDWTFKQTERSKLEETEEKPRLTHLERQTRESDGYYHARRLAFDLTKSEFRTPQKNMELIRTFLNGKLPAERRISRVSYVAKLFSLRFYPLNLEKDSFIAANVAAPIDAQSFLKRFGIS